MPVTTLLLLVVAAVASIVASAVDYHDNPLVVHTTSGLIRGFSRTVLDHKVHVFLGIPFAKPPLGPLRFRRPLEVEPWHGVLDATQMPNSCFQERYEYFPGFPGEEMWNPNTNISEDCLYLNVWVAQRNRIRHKGGDFPRTKLPILVWVYGGGYMSGTATLDIYNADLMVAANDIIVASIQYRVGAFGFLYLGPDSEEAPGNMGMWDQAMALGWLKENAAAFGGDKDLITIFGESAGGGSVSLHLLSPITRGLVRRGIIQSGTLNAPWSYMTGEKAIEIGRQLIDECNCNATQLREAPNKVMACMRSVDPKIISTTQWNTYWGILGFPSAPTIDGVFLPKHPIDLIREGNFDSSEILIGSNQNEGTYFILYDFLDYFEKDDSSNLPKDKFLDVINTIFKNMSRLERDAIIYKYTDWDHIDNGYIRQQMIGQMVGDYFFICPSNLFAQLMSDHGSKMYYYYFTQRTSSNLWGEWMGVMHGDEIEYVFGHPLNMSLPYTDQERKLAYLIMQVYTRFALTGKPVSEEEDWPPYTREKPQYFVFNADEKGLGRGPHSSNCAFWNEFMPKLRNSSDVVLDYEQCPPRGAASVELATTVTRSPTGSAPGLSLELLKILLTISTLLLVG